VERQATIVALQEQNEVLQEQIALLKKALFARRRERFIPSADQMLLFEPQPLDMEEGLRDEEASGELEGEKHVSDAPREKRRPKRKRFEFPQCLPIKRIEYPLPEEARWCPCGCGQRAVICEQIISTTSF
jgi:hypothetical protein